MWPKPLQRVVIVLTIVVIACLAVVSVFANSKIDCMVVTQGTTVARLISLKLSISPVYTCLIEGKLSYDNLPSSLADTYRKGIDILVAGFVKNSRKTRVSVTISFDTDVRCVSGDAIILAKTYSASDANINKVLDKVAPVFVKEVVFK